LNPYILSYYPSIYNSVAKLTSLTDQAELELLTREVLEELWRNKPEFEAEDRKGVYIYRLVLNRVFSYLRDRGDEERARFLRQILPIHPSHYSGLTDGKKNPLPGMSRQGDDDRESARS
jgi:DNA-directed RNA polymerase specialized sigma24 family protein